MVNRTELNAEKSSFNKIVLAVQNNYIFIFGSVLNVKHSFTLLRIVRDILAAKLAFFLFFKVIVKYFFL